tara:strand:- start:2507 stop:4078 length:1572 start_codon:yes stop_codon:yes gene_type:complete
MTNKFKKSAIALIGILVFVTISFFVANYKIKAKIKEGVASLPDYIKLDFQDMDVNSFSGNLSIENPLLIIYGRTTDSVKASFEMASIQINNLGYWNALFNDEINIDEILLNELKATYYHNKMLQDSAFGPSFKKPLGKVLNVGIFKINSGQIEIINQKTDSLMLKTTGFNFMMDHVVLDDTSIKNRIPFLFNDFELSSKDFMYQLNTYEDFTATIVAISNDRWSFNNVKLKTKYSRAELSKILSEERDHFDVEVETISFEDTDFGFFNNSTFQVKSSRVYFKRPKLKIYRDKLIKDDTSNKWLYSKMLSNINCNITLNEINIDNGEIVYEEKVNKEHQAGQLKFSDFNATIKKLGNTYPEPELTEISIYSVFMENTPLKIDWKFAVNNADDQFNFKADMGLLKTTHLNQFMKPNLNMNLKGELLKTYFTIDGNNNISTIDLKIDYDEFDVVILKDNGQEKNKLLSSLINLFVSKSSQDKTDNFRYGSADDVERDKTKSVFNFIWLNTKSGLLSAMTGSGEKNN